MQWRIRGDSAGSLEPLPCPPATRVADLVFSEKTVTDYDDAGAEPRFLERGFICIKGRGLLC